MATSSIPLDPIRIAQAVGLTSCALMTSASISMSFLITPIILKAPTAVLVPQWAHLFNTMKVVAQSNIVISSTSFFYLAYKVHSGDLGGWLTGYLIAGALNVAVAPYTLLVMNETNTKLLQKADEIKGLKKTDEVVEIGLGEETAHQLVDRWGVMNLGRAVALSTSLVLVLWNVLN